MLYKFTYEAPRDGAALLDRLADLGPKAKVLAGGTDLIVGLRVGAVRPEVVLDVKKVKDLSGISFSEAEGLVIRPAATINEVLRDRAVAERYPLLADCAHDLASYQIRNRATVVGNVVNASPCSDMAPALLCLGATAVLSSVRGERTVSFAEFFTGVKRTILAPDEILGRIVVPAASQGATGAYRKLKRINGHDLGIVGVALARGKFGLRIAVSSSAPTPVLVPGLGAKSSVEEAVAATLKSINPISDVRCSKEYRLFMVETYVRRLFAEVKA